MRTSQAYFKRFKAEFDRFAKELGLTHYQWRFKYVSMPGKNAQIRADPNGKTATVSLAKQVESEPTAEFLARHEVLHLLLADFSGLATYRHAPLSEIDEEEERVVRRLEKLFL